MTEVPRNKRDSGLVIQVMSLLEDAGLVKIFNRGSTFEDGMNKLSFILPDNVVHAIALGSGAYALITLGWIG
ncbi:MAG: hypothetical protein ABH803_00740 [Candidatus Micrarchaeota archaeon]